MLMLTGEARHLGYFSLGDLVSVDPTDADALLMDVQHDSGRLLSWLVEEPLQHVHNEVHRRVVVVEEQHLVEARPLGLRPRLGDDMGAGIVAPARITVPRHRQPVMWRLVLHLPRE